MTSELRRRLEFPRVKVDLNHFKDPKKIARSVYAKREFFSETFRTIIRACSVAFFIVTCALAFSYYPYHLQMRRLSNVVKSDLEPAVLNVNATTGCPEATLRSIKDPFEKFTVGSDVGFRPFSLDEIEEYKITKELIDEGERDTYDKWTLIQLHSRFLVIEEWYLLFLLVVFLGVYVVKGVMGSSLFVCGSVKGIKGFLDKKLVCCGERNLFDPMKEWINGSLEFLYLYIGVMCLLVVVFHEVSTYLLQGAQMKITEQYTSVCAPGLQHCFENNRMELCDFMRGSVAPGESDSVCEDENFVVPRCDIFGQDKVNAIDVISFGQYVFGGNQCSDNYCPLEETRSTKVTMASSEYWNTGGEGPLHLGLYNSFSWNSTQGVIVSMHVFAGLFIATMCIELLMAIVGAILAVCGKDQFRMLLGFLTSCCSNRQVQDLAKMGDDAIDETVDDYLGDFKGGSGDMSSDIFGDDAILKRRDTKIAIGKQDFLSNDKRFKINFV